MGTDWYAENVVANTFPGDSEEMRERFRDCLQEYRARLSEYEHLAATRQRILGIVERYPDGIARDSLRKLVSHNGNTSFGVICNQLARGGWIRQEGEGSKRIVFPAREAPMPDDEFARHHIPEPGTSGMALGG